MFFKDKAEPFSLNFIIYRCMIKERTFTLWDSATQSNRDVDVLMMFHKYDTQPFLLTLPFVFDGLGDTDKAESLEEFKHRCNKALLQEVK